MDASIAGIFRVLHIVVLNNQFVREGSTYICVIESCEMLHTAYNSPQPTNVLHASEVHVLEPAQLVQNRRRALQSLRHKSLIVDFLQACPQRGLKRVDRITVASAPICQHIKRANPPVKIFMILLLEILVS